MAGEGEVPFVKVEGGDAETLKRAFVVAKARAPCVLFVDGDPLIENVGIRTQLKQVSFFLPPVKDCTYFKRGPFEADLVVDLRHLSFFLLREIASNPF